MNRQGRCMNKEEPYRDQAERLRQRIEKVNGDGVEEASLMPPRSQIHKKKKKKTTVKVKYPLIRFLVLLFILLPLTIFAIYHYYGGKVPGIDPASPVSQDYDTVKIPLNK